MDFIKHLSTNHGINLNEQQQKAVLTIDGPILLLAVPGGGKTTVIVSRCANMVLNHKINPDSILTLTFSKASALDMKHRFEAIFGHNISTKLHFSTIHSFCFNVLRTYTTKMKIPFPTIIDDDKASINKGQLLRQLHQKFNNAYLADDKLEELSNAICYVKNMMLSANEAPKGLTDVKNFPSIYAGYESYKKDNNLIDFDDMLTQTLELFKSNEALANAYRAKYKYINVDESQDTSFLQHEIIKVLANPLNNIFMVGDEDQSIYTFRAAFPKALLDFEKTYKNANILLMEQNYRSTKNIVRSANNFIKQNKERYDKNMFTQKDDGMDVKYSCVANKNLQYGHIIKSILQESSNKNSQVKTDLKSPINLSETAILYRNNTSAIPLADALNRNKIPFYLRESKLHFFKHWVTTDILSFLELSKNPSNIDAFKQIYFKMNAYLSKAMLEFVSNSIKSDENIFDALLQYPELNGKSQFRIVDAKKHIEKLKTLSPKAAIDLIVKKLEYGEYLNRQGSEDSNSSDNLFQIVSGLLSISENAETIDDFKARLDELQHIIDSAKFNKGKNAITLSSIHSSKGLEFDNVYLIDLYEGQFPSSSSIASLKKGIRTEFEEEIRLFYVGATRARYNLELLTSSTLDGKNVTPSRFIARFMSVYEKPQLPSSANSLNQQNFSSAPQKKAPINGLKNKDIYLKMPVVHNKFGSGEIRSISKEADYLEIYFEKGGMKGFSLSVCLRNGLIKKG